MRGLQSLNTVSKRSNKLELDVYVAQNGCSLLHKNARLTEKMEELPSELFLGSETQTPIHNGPGIDKNFLKCLYCCEIAYRLVLHSSYGVYETSVL